jgi:glucokinase
VSKAIIGIDLGGTNVKTAVVSREGRVMGKDSRPTDAEKGLDAVLAKMTEGVDAALQAANLGRSDVLAVGIGAPGPMNWQTGVVFAPPNLPGWSNVPLAELMHERLGISVYVDNDANAACYGEFWLGVGRNVDSMILLTLGTGVGGGLVLMGQLLRGPDGTAGEIGHICVERDGRQCNCGARGCLEQYASVSGMVKTARMRIEQGGLDTALIEMCEGNLDNLTGKMISDAIEQGDAFAKWVMEETGRWLGVGIGSIINLLNPEMVVLAGGMIAAGDVLFTPVRETARAQSFEVPGKRAEIIPAGLGGDAGVIGAAGCALSRVEQD